jgi:hypothetical protein
MHCGKSGLIVTKENSAGDVGGVLSAPPVFAYLYSTGWSGICESLGGRTSWKLGRVAEAERFLLTMNGMSGC